MPRAERCFNTLLGLSILSWAVLGLLTTADARPLLVRAVITTLHAVVGTLIVRRGPVERQGSVASCLVAIPALVTAGWALQVAGEWTLFSQLLFLFGGAVATVSFLYLGRSCAILPAVREVVTSGPFRFARHPAYCGEVLMILACCLTAPGWSGIGPAIAVLPLIVLRITAEERVLSTSPYYVEYRQRVRWRLIPRVW